jgi:hypothetical protein
MLIHPRVHAVCLVNREERLIDVLDLRTLAADLVSHIIDYLLSSQVFSFRGEGKTSGRRRGGWLLSGALRAGQED